MTKFLLVRHGNTDAVGQYLSGHAPGLHINKDGERQLAGLTEALHNVALTAIVSSPLERTVETAQAVARDHGLVVEIDRAFIEFDIGEWTGAAFAAMAANDAWRRFNSARSITRAPRGELMIDVQRRAIGALLELRRRYPSGVVMVVSHG